MSKQKIKTLSAAEFQIGEKVRVRHGVMDPARLVCAATEVISYLAVKICARREDFHR